MAGWSGGVFTRARNWVTDKLNTVNPQASLFDQEDDNFATGLNNCITKDGTNKPSTTMDWNVQRLSNMAQATTTGDAAAFQTATFTGTLTGYAVNPTATMTYYIIGKMVYLFGPNANFTGTSNATTLTMTGLSAAIQPPAGFWYSICVVRNFGSDGVGTALVSGSVITFGNGAPGSAFTSSGNKGLPQGFCIKWPLV